MRSHYKNKDLLKIHPFYSSEIKSNKKNNKKISNISLSSKLPSFSKKLTNIDLSKELPFFPPKRKKRYKRLTKHQILSNILPFFDSAGISRKKYAFRKYAGTYEVEVMDSKSLDDSLFLAKRSIIDFFRDLLEEKRGFKYILSTRVTFKKWNNVCNTYDIDTIFRNSDPITVINKRFDLGTAFETLKHRLSIYSHEGSGWITDKIDDIWINVDNYDPLAGSSYFTLPLELKNSMKGLINPKNKNNKCFKWCHIRFINPQSKNSERINKQDKKIESTLD